MFEQKPTQIDDFNDQEEQEVCKKLKKEKKMSNSRKK